MIQYNKKFKTNFKCNAIPNTDDKGYYHYIYIIRGLFKNKYNDHYIYIGKWSTKNINDGYCGSGIALHNAYKKYPISKNLWEKEIIEFNESYDANSIREIYYIGDKWKDKNCLNLKPGGVGGYGAPGTFVCYDIINKKYSRISIDEFNLNKTQYLKLNTNMVTCFDNILNKNIKISKDEFNLNKNRYSGLNKNYIICFDNILNKTVRITKDEFNLNKNRYKHIAKGLIQCYDKEKKIIVSIEKNKFDSDKYETLVSCIDRLNNKKIKIPKSIFDSNKNRYCGPSKGKKRYYTQDGKCKYLYQYEIDKLNNERSI